MPQYARPETVPDALKLLNDGSWRILAGGTDLYPGAGPQLDGDILDITRLDSLRGISLSDAGLRIGAATTWSDLAEAALPPALAGLQQAAQQIGARQVQNVGTIGGNLCNASPAADGVPPLLTLDASVELTSSQCTRHLPLQSFLVGSRRTERRADEMLVAINLPTKALQGLSGFSKLGARAHLVISITMAAVRLELHKGRVQDIALAVGSCSTVAQRLSRVEAALRGQPVAGLADQVSVDLMAAHLSPISDIRASAEYRLVAATELVRRLVGQFA